MYDAVARSSVEWLLVIDKRTALSMMGIVLTSSTPSPRGYPPPSSALSQGPPAAITSLPLSSLPLLWPEVIRDLGLPDGFVRPV